MKIQLITIGNELLNGKTEDKNAFWMAGECFKRHFQLQKVHVIGDNEQLFHSALSEALKNADVVITTGGLGPTKDDLTKDMLCSFFKIQKTHNPRADEIILKHFKRGGRTYDYEKYDYHNVPLEMDIFENPTGYAPGLAIKTADGKIVCATPGVPNEYKAMVSEHVFPYLLTHGPKSSLIYDHLIIKTWKLPEADIFGRLCPTLWDQLAKYGEVSSLPHMVGVDIGIYLSGTDIVEIADKKKIILEVINKTALKDYIWHIGVESLEEVILATAKAKKIMFGFAESATGGLCSDRISNIAGSSTVFMGSVICYNPQIKIENLNVQKLTIKQYSVYSNEVAQEMAVGLNHAIKTQVAVAITGVAGPGDDGEHPAGKVSIAVAGPKGVESETFHFKGDRTGLKFRFSQMALFKLLEYLKTL